MGLDIRVYSNVKKVDGYVEGKSFVAHVIDVKWMARIKNLEFGENYTGDKSDILVSYPYSSHNDFRRELCKLLGYGKDDWLEPMHNNTAFWEFFMFADNDGCMDWETAKKLHDDFIRILPDAVEKLPTCWLEVYKKWLVVFLKASKVNSVIVYG